MVRGLDWKPTLEDAEVQFYLRELVGEEGLELFKFIQDNEPLTGVDILDAHPEVKPSAVRKLLYKMMEGHALEYGKETDSKGWETFHWATDLPEIGLIHVRRWQEEARSVQRQLKFELDHEFYGCAEVHRRMMFEDAVDLEFNCPTCTDQMNPVENKGIISSLEGRLAELQPALQ
jgi:transcription factor E